jgi:hypothetical protein
MSDRIVEVRVDELSLQGVRPVDRDRIAAAATRELERLLGQPDGWAGGSASVLDLDAGEVTLEGPDTPDALGTGIARAVYGRLVR